RGGGGGGGGGWGGGGGGGMGGGAGAGEPAQVEYFRNPVASKAKTARGWLRSGDMGHRDGEGWFYFDYRKGGSIRHNGDFINTGFIEKLIAEHPAVSDVFVYGVPAASGAPGEKDVVAAVVPVPGVLFEPRRIFESCRKGRAQLRPHLPASGRRDPEDRLGEAPGTLSPPALRAARPRGLHGVSPESRIPRPTMPRGFARMRADGGHSCQARAMQWRGAPDARPI